MSGVTLDSIRKTYGDVAAVDNVSLDIRDGELLALLERTGVRPVIDRVLPMDRAREAFEVMAAGDVRGKLVLTRG